MKNVILIIICGMIIIQAQIVDLQLSNAQHETAVESSIGINQYNGDIACAYKVHNSSNGAVDVNVDIIRNNQVIFNHRILNATDPVIDYDGNGNVILCYLHRGTYDIYIMQSTNNGETFLTPVLAFDAQNGWEADKQMMYIDKNPNSSYYNTIYIAFTFLKADQPSEINIVRSTNGGESFTGALRVSQQSPLGYFVSGVSLASDLMAVSIFFGTGNFQFPKMITHHPRSLIYILPRVQMGAVRSVPKRL